MGVRERGLLGAAVVLLVAYAAPLFVPPPAMWPAAASGDESVWERLFAGVPAWWVVARLGCLLAGTALLAVVVRDTPAAVTWPASAGATAPRGGAWRTRLQWAAVAVALLHAAAGLYADRLSPTGEVVYFAFLAVPALLLLAAERDGASTRLRARLGALGPLLAVPAVWLVARLPVAWHSPRAASSIDSWLLIDRLSDVVTGKQRVLSDSAIPGLSNAYMMLDGVFLIGEEHLASLFPWLQGIRFFWTALCAVGIGSLLRWTVSQPAALVGQAVFLFSPMVLMFPFDPQPLYLGPGCTVALLLLVLAVRDSGSGAALAAFGAVAGFSGRIPHLFLLTALLGCVMTWLALRARPRPWAAALAATGSFAAAVIPELPDPDTLTQTIDSFARGQGQLLGIMRVLLGQDSPLLAAASLSAGRAGALDVPLGAVLAPFAIARTPIRLLGDTLLDPAGTILLALGLALCLRDAYRQRIALLPPLLWLAGGATAVVASGDAVSHTRLVPALPALAWLSAIGFEALRRAFAPAARGAPFTAVAVAASMLGGIVIFDRVNPSIVASSWGTIALEAVPRRGPDADVALVDYDTTFLHTGKMAAQVPVEPLAFLPAGSFEAGVLNASTPPTRVYLWSPAVEAGGKVSERLCARWPETTLYVMRDRAGLSEAWAAAPPGRDWRPALDERRWVSRACAPRPD